MPCSPGVSPSAPFDSLPSTSSYSAIGPGYNFALNGVGTRDLDTNTTPASFAINIPAGSTIIDAYLYVNTLDQNPGLPNPTVEMSVNGGPYTTVDSSSPYDYSMIGWCNEPCWLAFDDGSHEDGASSNDQNIYAHVYRGDVTSLVLVGNNTYSFKIPGISRGPNRATLASDQPYYPGCFGSEGIALLIIYNDGTGVVRNFQFFDGAKLLNPDPGVWGGSSTWAITFNPGLYWQNAKIALAVGDPQTTYSDKFCFNGITCLPENGSDSALNPVNGNLMGTYTISSTCVLPPSQSNSAVMDVSGDVECLVWFLFVFLAEQPAQCSPPDHSLIGSLSPFRNLTGFIDYVTGGVGTRDQDIAVVPGNFSVYVPGVPVEAYLYWNVFVDDTVDASHAILNSINHTGTMIGKVGNTCWSPPNPCGIGDMGFDGGIKNQIWRASILSDVLTAIPSGGLYNASVTLPNVHTDANIAFQASDSPHFPGCNSSQGIVLLVIYETKCNFEKQVIVYDGGVLLVPTVGQSIYGGTESYSITFPTAISSDCAKVTLAIGDAQSQYQDTFTWNGNPLPEVSGSYANPYVGNLMHLLTSQVTAQVTNTIAGSTSNDCLDWFLFCFSNQVNCPAQPNPTAPKDQLGFFKGFIGDVDYTAGCAGIRDIDTNITPANITVAVPGPVIKAYLYWNVIGARAWNPSVAILDNIPVQGCLLGWGGDTCWYICQESEGNPGPGTELNIINKTYRADVTSLVSGSGTYAVRIPTQTTTGVQTTSGMLAGQTVTIPGCCSGQGIVLLVIYRTPHEVIPIPSCCPTTPTCYNKPCAKQTVYTTRKQVLIFDGAVTLRADGGPDDDPSVYHVPIKTHYKNNIKIMNGVGDAQATFEDCFYWDGTPLSPCPQYFNPYCGNLLHIKFENPAGGGPCDCQPVEHLATAQSIVDCLHWFLFVYSGTLQCVDSTITVTRKGPTRFVGCK